MPIRFEWDERKRWTNLERHGFDFADAAEVFEGFTLTYEDDRFAYGEQRFITLGLLRGVPVSIAHLESPRRIRLISFRKATRHEEAQLFRHLPD